MPSALRDRRREQLRREIADQALALAEEQGWAHVTVAQVAARAGISRRAFFTHFATKDDAVVYGACDDLELLEAVLEEHPQLSFVEVLRAHADDWVDEVGSMGRTRRTRNQVEREHPDIALKIAAERAATLRRISAAPLARDLDLPVDHPLAQLAAASFAGMAARIDELFTTDMAAAREHVRISLRLLEALVAHPRD